MRYKSSALMEEIQNFAEQFCVAKGRTPSTAEMATALGVCKATIHNYLKEMNEKGILSYEGGEIRSALIDKVQTEQVGIPIAGTIPCGPAEEQLQVIEEIVSLPRAVVGKGDFFMLHAAGDSMVDAGIDEGDLVIVRRQLTASQGQIVAAIVDGGSTLKRLQYDENGNVILCPENDAKNYPPIRGASISIQGVAVRVLKDLA